MRLLLPGSASAFKPAVFAAATFAALLIASGGAHAAAVAGSSSLGTDYVWRGVTQTEGDPAVQAGLKLAGQSGLYASVWGSNVNLAPGAEASIELDFTLGWTGNLASDWVLDVNLTRYQYPSSTVDLNWTELTGSLTYDGKFWLAVSASPEALGSDERGIYTQVGARLPVNDRLRLESAIGYYALDELYDDSYVHGQVSAIWLVKAPVELRLSAHATDSSAEENFGAHMAGNRLEAALQASF